MDNDPVISPYFSVQQNFQSLSVQYPPVGRARPHYYSESPADPSRRRNSVGGDLSDRISKLIADNDSIVGTQKAQPSSKPSDRKRVTKGPWRYEERIQQLGYQPNSSNSRQPSKVRRNSLPVHPLGFNRELLRPYPAHDFPQPRSLTRRASLPTAPALVMSQRSPQEITWRVNMSSFSQQARPSVICENPIYRSNKKEQDKKVEEPMNVDSKSDDEEVDIIVVDEDPDPPVPAYKNPVIPSTIVTPIDHPMSVIKSAPPAPTEEDPSLAFGESSSVIKPTAAITNVNSNKTGGINAEVISALQEVEYRAKKTAENCGSSDSNRREFKNIL